MTLRGTRMVRWNNEGVRNYSCLSTRAFDFVHCRAVGLVYILAFAADGWAIAPRP